MSRLNATSQTLTRGQRASAATRAIESPGRSWWPTGKLLEFDPNFGPTWTAGGANPVEFAAGLNVNGDGGGRCGLLY